MLLGSLRLRWLSSRRRPRRRALRLDLRQLLGADAGGLRALRRQRRLGACFTGVSPYMELLLETTVWRAEDESEK
jgi:hypothetical protein